MLTQFFNQQKQNDWDLKLDKITFAYNTTVNATKKLSPFKLLFGRVPKLPIDLVIWVIRPNGFGRTRKPEEDSSSEERDQYRKSHEEPTSQRNEEPEVGTLSNRRLYKTRGNQKEQSTRQPLEKVGRIEKDDHLNLKVKQVILRLNRCSNTEERATRNPQ